MAATHRIQTGLAWVAGLLGFGIAAYAACAGLSWYRYGRVPAATHDESDPLLDRFMPEYDVVERHHAHVRAPAEITLSTAAAIDLRQSAIVRTIFRARELVLRPSAGEAARPHGLLAEMKSLGWGVLAETPGREIVVGAFTQPWMADVVFRALPPDEFAAFQAPGYVKIAWTLRADPVGREESIFRTETRVATVDPTARRKFRWYWARFSPGIVLIRRAMLHTVKREAERRAGLARLAS